MQSIKVVPVLMEIEKHLSCAECGIVNPVEALDLLDFM